MTLLKKPIMPSLNQQPKNNTVKPKQQVRVLPAVMIAIVCLLGFKALEWGRNFGQAEASTEAPKEKKAAPKADAKAKAETDPALAAAAADMDAGAAPVEGGDTASPLAAGSALPDMKVAEAAAPGATAGAPSTTQFCPGPSAAEQAGLSASEAQVLQSLASRRKTLEGREEELNTREQLIASAEKRVEQRLAEMKALQARVQQALGGLDEKADADTAALVSVYEKMKPKAAAAVMETLDDDVALRVARRMKVASLAVILGNMSPPRAKRLTELLAKRVDAAKVAAEAAVTNATKAAAKPKAPAGKAAAAKPAGEKAAAAATPPPGA